MIYDKRIANQVLGCLFKDPGILANTDNYILMQDDFIDRLHKIIFSSIYNMYHNGAENISINEFNNYLKSYPELFNFFNESKGNETLLTAAEIGELENFKYYYDKLKKLSLLRSLEESGFDIKYWYQEGTYDIAKRQELELRLEQASINDIVNYFQAKLFNVESSYINKKNFTFSDASDGVADLKERLKIVPEIGYSLEGSIFTTISRGARKTKLYMMSADSGNGKAIPNSTVIPTPNGDKKVGNIVIGDYLFDREGNPTKVIGVFPQGEKEVWEVTFKDGRKAKCCEEHLWGVINNVSRNKKIEVFSLKDLNNKKLKNNHGWHFSVPLNEAVKYRNQNLSIDPYVFGLIIGDGSFRYDKTNKTFSFSSKNSELPDAIAQILNLKVKKSSEKNFNYYFYSIINNKNKTLWVEELLKDFPELWNSYSQDKFIPEIYLKSSIQQRKALLQGLLDTDGGIDQKGTIYFNTISEKLKNNVIELCQSLGYIVTISEDNRTKYKNGICYTLRIQAPIEEKINFFRLTEKKNKIMFFKEKELRKENKKINSIIKIEKLNYKENMTCFTVDNSEHLFLMNDFIVTHNTRNMVGNACKMAFPFRWDNQKEKWINSGSNQKIIFVTTELEKTEIQTMIIAYLSGVNEENILNGQYTPQQEKRIDQAIQIIEKFSNNFWIYHLPDPTIHQLNTNLRRLVITKQIDAVFYDYIHSSPQLLGEFQGMKVREDVILMLLSTALKNLANELNVFIWTGTQLNASGKEAEFADENCIRGSRAVVDKIDFGCIIRPATLEFLKTIKPILEATPVKPNMFIDIYKNRRSKYKRVRLWVDADLGTCRIKDLFLTDEYGTLLPIDLLTAIDQSAQMKFEEIINFDLPHKEKEIETENKIKITI